MLIKIGRCYPKAKRNVAMGKFMKAWKEKRNWEEKGKSRSLILIAFVVFSVFLVIDH